jgi:hypothetical protein
MMEEYKGYKIITAEANSNYKQIKPIGKGSIPTVLTGLYTTTGEARSAIDIERSIHQSKVKTNASKKSNG